MKNLYSLWILVLLWGCTSPRYVYTPSAINNPFLTEKGDGEIQAAYSTSASDAESGSSGSSVNGLDLMGSYAVANNFGIQAHYYYRGEKDSYTLSWPNEGLDGTIKYNRNEFELGIGGFVPLDKSKSIIFSGWAGVGFGGTAMNESNVPNGGSGSFRTGNFDYKTTRLYFQPSFNFIVSEYFKCGIVARVSSMRFSNVSTNFNQIDLIDRQLDNLGENNLTLVDAGYNLSFGFRGMKNMLFTHQLSFAGSSGGYYDIRPLNFSFGVCYVIKPKAGGDNNTGK